LGGISCELGVVGADLCVRPCGLGFMGLGGPRRWGR
jgi:hypothetical protein